MSKIGNISIYVCLGIITNPNDNTKKYVAYSDVIADSLWFGEVGTTPPQNPVLAPFTVTTEANKLKAEICSNIKVWPSGGSWEVDEESLQNALRNGATSVICYDGHCQKTFSYTMYGGQYGIRELGDDGPVMALSSYVVGSGEIKPVSLYTPDETQYRLPVEKKVLVFKTTNNATSNVVGSCKSGDGTLVCSSARDGWYVLSPNSKKLVTFNSKNDDVDTYLDLFIYRKPDKYVPIYNDSTNTYTFSEFPQRSLESLTFLLNDEDIQLLTVYSGPGEEYDSVGKFTGIFQSAAPTITAYPVPGYDGWYAYNGPFAPDDPDLDIYSREWFIYLSPDKYSEMALVNEGDNNVRSVTTMVGADRRDEVLALDRLISGVSATDRTFYEASSNISQFATKNGEVETSRIFGIPFHFTYETDYPFYDQSIVTSGASVEGVGREFVENIYSEAPIVYFLPGIPSFMPDVSASDKAIIDNYIKTTNETQDKLDAGITEAVNDINGRYYDFVPAYNEYIKYVNLLCRSCAIMLNIGKRNAPGTTTPYASFNWSRYSNFEVSKKDNEASSSENSSLVGKIFSGIADTISVVADGVGNELFGEYQYVKCYVNPSTSIHNSFANTTRDSHVKSLFDSLSDTMKEINFFINDRTGLGKVKSAAESGISALSENLAGIDSEMGLGLSQLIGSAGQVLTGSNLSFPELWSESDFGQGYSFSIDLVSPYGDVESIYLNIIVPMMHIIALAAPRQITANSYGSPFLVRMFSKGWCSADLGIISDIEIVKGGDGDAWTPYGLPTAVRIDLTVRDLYSKFMISKASTPAKFFQNNGLIDFLAVTCGVNVVEPNFTLKMRLMMSLYTNAVFDMPSNIYDRLIRGIRNTVTPIFSLTGSTM